MPQVLTRPGSMSPDPLSIETPGMSAPLRHLGDSEAAQEQSLSDDLRFLGVVREPFRLGMLGAVNLRMEC